MSSTLKPFIYYASGIDFVFWLQISNWLKQKWEIIGRLSSEIQVQGQLDPGTLSSEHTHFTTSLSLSLFLRLFLLLLCWDDLSLV